MWACPQAAQGAGLSAAIFFFVPQKKYFRYYPSRKGTFNCSHNIAITLRHAFGNNKLHTVYHKSHSVNYLYQSLTSHLYEPFFL